jgi:hypothetical protein
MARTEVTREINTYIRAHNLQDRNNGRRIFADAKLRKLLKLTKEDELTYFNLQRYMSPHFAKATGKSGNILLSSSTDPKTGQIYYYNTTTHETTWTKPTEVVDSQNHPGLD